MIKNQALGRSNKALIFLGLFLGLVSAVLVVLYLSKAKEEGGGDVSGAATTPVVVASESIALGTRITEGMVTVKPIASNAVLADAFGKAEDVVGKVTKVPLVEGEQVIPTKVTATGPAIANLENPPLAYVIPEGMRAVSIEVNSVIGASGLIRPGDFVDIILTIKVEGLQGGTETASKDQVARTILQNAQVLSIDEEVARTVVSEDSGGAPPASDSADANPEATTVTLAVSPVHGEVLTVAESCGENFDGRLSLALRPFGDSSAVGTRSQWAADGAPPTCSALLGMTGL